MNRVKIFAMGRYSRIERAMNQFLEDNPNIMIQDIKFSNHDASLFHDGEISALVIYQL